MSERAAAFASSMWAGFLIGAAIGALSFYLLGLWEGQSAMQSEAIERGYAQHCPKSGEWAWKGECDE